MFEKEADKYVKVFTDRSYIWSNDKLMQLQLREAYKDGAEFGYKKGIKTLDDMTRAFNREHKKYTDLRIANEWHFVKDGDLPKDEDWKLCVSYRGYYYVAKYEEMFGCWTNREYSEVMQPYAWKEIVLPELKEKADDKDHD